MFIFKYGAMPMEEATRSMRLFAKEVLPAIKKFNPGPMTATLEGAGLVESR
jgi:hypothetical protein